jgi:hypothetical protein
MQSAKPSADQLLKYVASTCSMSRMLQTYLNTTASWPTGYYVGQRMSSDRTNTGLKSTKGCGGRDITMGYIDSATELPNQSMDQFWGMIDRHLIWMDWAQKAGTR